MAVQEKAKTHPHEVMRYHRVKCPRLDECSGGWVGCAGNGNGI